MRPFRVFILVWVALFILVGCTTQPTPTPQQQSERPAAPTPVSDKSVVTGQVLTASNNVPITQTPVYLARIYWDADHKNAAFALDLAQSPSTKTDNNGFFTLTDVPPSEYALIIGDYYGRNEVVREGNGNARIYQPTAGKTVDIGTVQVQSDVQIK